MIISLRGTSGSGKSHLVRRIVALYSQHRAKFQDGRMKPLYELHGRNREGRVLVTPGHYEIANGGIDTLSSLDDAYRIAKWGHAQGHDVLMEGKNMSDGVKFVDELHTIGTDVRVVVLMTPVEECVASVRARGHRIAATSIEKTARKIAQDALKFLCPVHLCTRDEAYDLVREWLGPFGDATRGEA